MIMIPTDRPVRSVERKRLTICLRIPPLSTHTGRRGSFSVLMPETADDTQGQNYFQHELVEIDHRRKEAVFQNLASGERTAVRYDMIHVTPPMSSPDVIKQSKLAASTGWVEVDQFSLQHVRYPNVFALGDCSNLPTSKTGAAIRKQAPTLVENLLAAMDGRPLEAVYDGYTSCPLVTGYGSLILAEFDYQLTPKESFPFDQSKERYSMYALKAYGLPAMYWNGMLRGRM